MQLKYLGTSAAEGLPGVFCMCESCRRAQSAGGKNLRLRSSVLINGDLLIDLSPDLVYLKMKYAIDIDKVRTVLITHTHQDHFSLQSLSYNYNSFTTKPVQLKILLSNFAAESFRKTQFEKNEAKDNFHLKEVTPFLEYNENRYTIVPLVAAHNTPQSFLYLISQGGVNMLYGNDTGSIPQSTFDYLKNIKLDIVSLDGTMGKGQAHENRHMGFNEIIETKKQFIDEGICNKNSIFIVTHFSHFINMLHEEIEEYLKPHGILTAYDGMIIEKK